MIHVIGGGLAGSEAAWQAASAGVPVVLYEMRPVVPTPVHRTDRLAELVCSNSFRSDKLDNAVGLLKAELRRLGSIIMRAADETRVPAGAALAVDRERFADAVTAAIQSHPRITVRREPVNELPLPGVHDGLTIIATGPLTADGFAEALGDLVGRGFLHFYDAISPIVLAESVDMGRVFRASRWNRNLGPRGGDGSDGVEQDGAGGEEGDYVNCPLDEGEYARFYEALVSAERAAVRDIDRVSFFEGCLPVEIMAERGPDTLRFGPMKPVGLIDPRTGRQPYAVVQLRQDNLARTHYSLVGFQTQLAWGAQQRVLRLIPGLERAEFVRFGTVHRNSYLNAPAVLTETWQVRTKADVLVAGQLSGVEGYVEAAASGLAAGLAAVDLARGRSPLALPRTTAIGALAYYVSHARAATYEPANITFGILSPLDTQTARHHRSRLARNRALAARALADLARWQAERERQGVLPIRPAP